MDDDKRLARIETRRITRKSACNEEERFARASADFAGAMRAFPRSEEAQAS